MTPLLVATGGHLPSRSSLKLATRGFIFGELEALAKAFILSTQSIQQQLSSPQHINSIISDRAELAALVIYAASTIAERLRAQQFINRINAQQAELLRELLAQQGMSSALNDEQSLAALVETAAVIASAPQFNGTLLQSLQSGADINTTSNRTGTLS